MATTLLPDLGDLARLSYRDAFARAVAEHRVRPLILPYSLLGPFILCPLWLAIPHTNRPWLYHTRWLVIGLVVVVDLDIILSTSSRNVACAYGAGLMGLWGILLTFDLLVWSRPQFDAARAVLLPKSTNVGVTANGPNPRGGEMGDGTGDGAGDGTDIEGPRENGLRQRIPDSVATSDSHVHVVAKASRNDEMPQHKDPDYVWQPFPEDGSFLQRLNWSMDFVTNYRCIGWNRSVPSVPLPQIPARIRAGDPVSLHGMPVVSRSGYRRSLTKSEFIWARVRTVAALYLVLDFLAVFMVKDPYFIYGPDRSDGHSLPPFLSRLPSWALLTYRELFSLAGFLAAIAAIFNLHDILQYYVFSHIFPIRGELWQYTSIFGSFSQVLDRGLAGWWGAWWHQTFRLQFSSPATYLIRKRYLSKGTLTAQIVTMFVSFFQSGLLHASGSQSSMPNTKIWRSPAFFVLQPPGIMVQQSLNRVMDIYLPRIPKIFRQAFNLLFTLAWLQVTAQLFCDDIASTGLWLLEPVPISPFRWLGFGHPNDHWWRWNRELLPMWYSGDYWWTSGLQI
ncbi:hypothetical protein G7Z17_g12015 [Cylindrodendrum hubeiense]|uniref:Wax synthase domain-containing protein n=1 Tax=Cylindrodendrum hubeiense TaxID=595255 RepID=A0A9P5H2V1_9HYPO|nr:hypothetical protein G7Z17_g12015 [Cylindrodendrum hubeiense]